MPLQPPRSSSSGSRRSCNTRVESAGSSIKFIAVNVMTAIASKCGVNGERKHRRRGRSRMMILDEVALSVALIHAINVIDAGAR